MIKRLFDFAVWYIRDHQLSFAEWLVVLMILSFVVMGIIIHIAAIIEKTPTDLINPFAY